MKNAIIMPSHVCLRIQGFLSFFLQFFTFRETKMYQRPASLIHSPIVSKKRPCAELRFRVRYKVLLFILSFFNFSPSLFSYIFSDFWELLSAFSATRLFLIALSMLIPFFHSCAATSCQYKGSIPTSWRS